MLMLEFKELRTYTVGKNAKPVWRARKVSCDTNFHGSFFYEHSMGLLFLVILGRGIQTIKAPAHFC